MKIIDNISELNINNGLVVVIGKFDALHIGHKALIDEAVRIKNKTKLSVLLISFFPNIFNRDNKYILNNEEKIKILNQSDIDYYYQIPLTKEFSLIDREDFLQNFLYQKLNMKYIVCGSDFTFGKDRLGDVSYLEKKQNVFDYNLVVKDKIKLDDVIVSTELIKSLISKGELEKASRYLGRDYHFSGIVESGNHIGKKINIPTINIKPGDKVLPLKGVYKSYVLIDDNKYKSITNIGTKPTVSSENLVTIETNILDYDNEIYDNYVEVFIEKFIRAERKFKSLVDLQKQINSDIKSI